MKVWSNSPNNSGYNTGDNCINLCEDDEYIFIDGQAHEKDTLSPVFNKRCLIPSDTHTMKLANMVKIPYNLDNNRTYGSSSGLNYYGPFTYNVHTHNHGQVQMIGIKNGQPNGGDYSSHSLYISKFNNDTIYTHMDEYNGYYTGNNASFASRRKSLGYSIGNYIYGPRNSTDGHYIDTCIWHETSNNVHGFHLCKSLGSWHSGVGGWHKSGDPFWTGGFSYDTHVNTILYKDEETIILACSDYNDSRFAIRKYNWNDGNSHGANNNVYYRADYASSDGYRNYLKWWVKADDDEYEPTASNQWHFDNNSNHAISDATIVGNPDSLNISITPAIVAVDNNSVHPTIRRCYAPYFEHDTLEDDYFQLAFTRLNIPIKGHESFDNTDAPVYDIRKCEIDWNFSETNYTSFRYHDFRGANGEDMYLGSDVRGHVFLNSAFFEDIDPSNNKPRHYIHVTLDSSDGLTNYSRHPGGTRSLVFQITGIDFGNTTPQYDYSTANVHETDSCTLKLLQVMDISIDCGYQTFRPEYDPKKFVAFQMREDTHQLYQWNSSTMQFETNTSIVGRHIIEMGVDSTGRMWTTQMPENGVVELHTHELDYPSSVKITPEHSSYSYTGSKITTHVKVGAFNHEGTRLELKLKLQIRGTNASFNGSSTLLETEITTNTSNDTTVQIYLTGATNLDITATHLNT